MGFRQIGKALDSDSSIVGVRVPQAQLKAVIDLSIAAFFTLLF